MPRPSSSSPIRFDSQGRLRFASINHLCTFLGISPPYKTCIAYAPYARNAPHCSRSINKRNQASVPGLLADLLETTIPSTRAGLLLEKLSTCAVCGVVAWHQNKAPGIFQEWCEDLWNEYLKMHRLEPRLCGRMPSRLTRHSWNDALEAALLNPDVYSGITSDSDTESESDSDLDSDSNSSEGIATPNSASSTGRNLPSQLQSSGGYSARPPRRPEPPANSSRLPARPFEVYRDTESQPTSEDRARASNSRTVANPRALQSLDRNIPTSRTGDPKRPPPAHEATEAGPSSPAVPRPAHSVNATIQPEDEVDNPSNGEETPAIQSDESPVSTEDNENREGDGGDEQAQLTPDSPFDQESVRAAGDSDAVSSQLDAEEYVVVSTTEDDESRPNEHRLENDAVWEDDPAAGILGLYSAFEDDNTVEAMPSEGSTDITIVTPNSPGFRTFPQAAPMAQLKQLLRNMTETVSHRKRYSGFIYAFSRPSLPGFLKIGYTNDTINPRRPYPDPVDNRLAQWSSVCGHPAVEVFRERIPCAAVERIEGFVHQTLREYRRVEDPGCKKCQMRAERQAKKKNGNTARTGPPKGGHHDEWFEVDEQTVRRVVGLWRLFSEEMPYDRFGRLVDFWSEKANGDRLQVGEGGSVMSWIEAMPRMVEESRRRGFSDIIGSFGRLSV